MSAVGRDALFDLLPAVHRQRDEQRGAPLRQLLEVLTDELAVVGDGIDQLYDDLFAETAAPWALPYLAELIGLRGLPSGTDTGLSARAEVANTIGYRRRKGTAAVLEQVARDVTGWPTRAVEFFELIAATQHVNHVRPANRVFAPVRDARRMGDVGSPFERHPVRSDPTPAAERLRHRADLTHTVDVRRIRSRGGRYNIGNVGLFSWRLRAYPLTASPAVPADPADPTRFHLHPLGVASPLMSLPVTEDEITQLAEPVNVPHPLGRRELAAAVGTFCGPGLTVSLPDVDSSAIDVCDLSDTVDAGGNPVWAHTPRAPGRVAIDPVLGRVAYGDSQASPPLASHHYGFGAELGGGEYDRAHTFSPLAPVVPVSQQDPTVPQATVDAGVAVLTGNGVVEVGDSGRYGPVGDLTLSSRMVEIRAGDRCRPVVLLNGDWVVDGDGEGELTLNGLLLSGGSLRVRNVRAVRLTHCTLVPGISLDPDGSPTQPGVPSVVVESPVTTLTVDRCVLGPIRAHVDAEVVVTDSLCDAGQEGVAYAADTGEADGGGPLTLQACTVLGKIHARTLELVSNSIVLAAVGATDDPSAWPGPVLADRRQHGCVRFSYLPPGSRTPRRYRCQPTVESDAARVRPVLTSQHYPDAAYGQLDRRTPTEITGGADDESEMGVFHHLYTPQRAAYLAARLDDYLRFGLEAGFFFAS